MKFGKNRCCGQIRDALGRAPENRSVVYVRLHPAQHLTECAVQSAKRALERLIALVFLVGRRLVAVRVKRRVRECAVLREEQQQDTKNRSKSEPALCHDRAAERSSSPRQSRSISDLRLDVVLDTDFADEIELRLEPVDMLFFRLEYVFEQLTTHVVAA